MIGKTLTRRRMDKHVGGINQRLRSHGACRNRVFENGLGGVSAASLNYRDFAPRVFENAARF